MFKNYQDIMKIIDINDINNIFFVDIADTITWTKLFRL